MGILKRGSLAISTSDYTMAEHPFLTTGKSKELFDAFRAEVLLVKTNRAISIYYSKYALTALVEKEMIADSNTNTGRVPGSSWRPMRLAVKIVDDRGVRA